MTLNPCVSISDNFILHLMLPHAFMYMNLCYIKEFLILCSFILKQHIEVELLI